MAKQETQRTRTVRKLEERSPYEQRAWGIASIMRVVTKFPDDRRKSLLDAVASELAELRLFEKAKEE